MPYTGYCKWDDCDPDRTNPRITVSNYIYHAYRTILCREHLKKFKKMSKEEKVAFAKEHRDLGLPRYSVR